MFGESPLAIPLYFERTTYPAIQDRMKSLIQNQEEALAAHELARSQMADQRKSMFVPFTKGDQVWLDPRNLKTIYHKKMKPKWEGPFFITEVLGPVTYRLQPELEEGEEVYDMETILNHRKRGQGYQYFVKWWGYPITNAS